MTMHPRLTSLRKQMRSKGIDSFIVTNLNNVMYITGFTGSWGALMVDSGAATLITDFRYAEQVEEETSGFDIKVSKEVPLLEAAKMRNGFKGRLGFEAKSISYLDFGRMEKLLSDADLVPCENLIQEMRAVKDSYEIGKIMGAAGIGDDVFSGILKEVKPGVCEADLAAEIDYQFRKRGSLGPAFETIVASGPRSSMPHARAGTRKFESGDMITFDMGVLFEGYCADMTRTVVLGKADDSQKRIYSLVLDAQKKALDMIRPGVKCSELDRAARGKIEDAGYGENFGHRLGHGVGIEVHEEPGISSKNETEVVANMVFTVEPGVYLPKRWGIRIEDTVIVREEGCEMLTRSPKEMLEL